MWRVRSVRRWPRRFAGRPIAALFFVSVLLSVVLALATGSNLAEKAGSFVLLCLLIIAPSLLVACATSFLFSCINLRPAAHLVPRLIVCAAPMSLTLTSVELRRGVVVYLIQTAAAWVLVLQPPE